ATPVGATPWGWVRPSCACYIATVQMEWNARACEKIAVVQVFRLRMKLRRTAVALAEAVRSACLADLKVRTTSGAIFSQAHVSVAVAAEPHGASVAVSIVP